MSGASEVVGGVLEQRPDGQGDQGPQIEGQHQWRKQTESRGVGGTRLVHRVGVIAVLGAIGTMLVTWTVFLVYAAMWMAALIA